MTSTNRKLSIAKDIQPKPARKAAPGGLRDDLKRFTRERLITAAMESFAAEGFRTTSVERIVELAGTTVPTFYRHFSSKNELLVPLQDRLTQEVTAIVNELEGIGEINGRSVRAWMESYMRMWRRMHKLCVAYWEAIELDKDMAANALPASMKMIASVQGFLDRFPQDRRSSAQIRMAIIIPLMDRAVQTISALADNALQDRMLDEFAHMIALALRHPGPVD